jgi:sortase (surface protein transpeptidase)
VVRKRVEVTLVILIVAGLVTGLLASRDLVHAGAREPSVRIARASGGVLAGAPPAATASAAFDFLAAPVGEHGPLDGAGAAQADVAARVAADARTALAFASAESASTSVTTGGAASGGGDGSATTGSPDNPHGLAPVDAPSPVVARIRVPVAGIDAEVDTGYVDHGTNAMLAPRGPWVVDWYPYSAVPGRSGNAVFAGHVDYVGIGDAVFWHLRDLGPGDRIEVQLADGSVLEYAVQFNRVYSAASGPWESLFSPSADTDVITLYTCDGTFHAGSYNDRRVVRATRVG